MFVFLANVIGRLFFPADLPAWVCEVQTFGIFAAGYLARPMGGVFMGQLSDRCGRKTTFTLLVLLMAVPTFLIGCLPTYHTIGAAAPLSLLLLRIGQGAAIGGEAPAAWVFVAESAPARCEGLAVGLLKSGLSLGILLGSLVSVGLSVAFTPAQILSGGWRFVFILGGIFGLITMLLRRRLSESPIFQQMRNRAAVSPEVPIRVVVKEHKAAVALSMALTWSLTAMIIVVILMGPPLLQALFAVSARTAQIANAAGTFSLCLSVAALGALSDRFGLPTVMGPTLLLSIVADYLLYWGGFGTGPHTLSLFYILAGIATGSVVLRPILMIRSFPTSVRVTGVSFSYNIAYAVFGGLTPP